MGLAASQARLLSLTSRQHTVEHRAQFLQAQKLRLANESDAAYEKYINALDATQIQTKMYSTSGDASWVNASVINMMRLEDNYNGLGNTFYLQDINSGLLYTTEKVKTAYDESKDMTEFLERFGITTTQEYSKEYQNALNTVNEDKNNGWNQPLDSNFLINYYAIIDKDDLSTQTYSDMSSLLKAYGYKNEEEVETKIANYNQYLEDFETLNSTDSTLYDVYKPDQLKGEHYAEIYNAIKYAGGCTDVSYDNAKSDTWVTNMVKNAQIVLAKYNSETQELDNVSASSNTSLQEISNDDEVTRADTEYETKLVEIDDKEKKYDTKLKQLESERSAIDTEIDSLKQVAKDNIEKTFKLFS